MRIETIAVHGGHAVDPATGAVTLPIQLSTTFEHEPDGTYPRGFIYSLRDNPNRRALEDCLRQLEGGAECVAFSSGSAATTSVLRTLAPGDHVVAPSDAYYGTARLLREVHQLWGLSASFVEMSDPNAVAAAMRPNTRLVWVETPSNPLLRIVDIKRIAEIARTANALCVCDNTFATPVLQRPLQLGAHAVVHATTKYLGGHSDVVGGAVVSAAGKLAEALRKLQRFEGAVPSPFDCWLTLRGIRTLPYRMYAHSEHAAAVAQFVSGHPNVSAVHYPGLPGHAGHDIAARQMDRFGGMLSIQVKGGATKAMAVTSKVKVFVCATSLGGIESLIEHRASIEGPASTTPADLLRLSVGLEHPDDLIEDLDRALA